MLTDASVLKVLQNAKFDLQVLGRRGVPVAPVDDTMLIFMHWEPERTVMEWMNWRNGFWTNAISIKELLGTGKSDYLRPRAGR